MALPPNASIWTQPMDPTDLVEFIADFGNAASGSSGAVLAEGEAIDTYTVTMSAEGAALGVTISEEAGYETTLVESDKAIRIWIYVDEADREDPAFAGAGLQLGVTFTINTNSVPPRRKQKTYILEVAQQ